MDQKGYVMSGLSFLLAIPAIFLVAVLVDMVHIGSESQSRVLQSDATFYAAEDIEFNTPIITEKTLQKITQTVIQSGKPLEDSRLDIKNALQGEMDSLSKKYSENGGINVKCTILSVDSSPDPFKIRVKSTVYVNKGSITHNESLSQDISIIDTNYPIPDPIPFIKCKSYGGITNTSTKICYGSSLVNFLKTKNMTNAEAYENSSSSLFIKKCPYDPYIGHGNSKSFIVLKNCIETGYFHESSDGACFLCRLEGKATCPHYGFETFIVPSNSSNLNIKSAPCSIDHVIFNETSYPGKEITYYVYGVNHYRLFLDNGHRQKYGLPMY
ncbi:MAG: hypothetical protein HZC47_08895 [Methanobacterium sp.]|uniref:hypothetical protein n=1 Tax=Methanobacterium sp. TaxID=2164 RepID=UPI003D65D3C4|nr:hypothetical protein [Methanobacterium sp.]